MLVWEFRLAGSSLEARAMPSPAFPLVLFCLHWVDLKQGQCLAIEKYIADYGETSYVFRKIKTWM